MEYAVPIAAAIAAIVGSWITVRAGRKKNDADAAKTLTDIAMGFVNPLQNSIQEMKKEMARMERKIKRLEDENALLHKWSQLLFTQVIEAGHDPITFDRVKYLENGDA